MKGILLAVLAFIAPVYGGQKSANAPTDQKQIQSIENPTPPTSRVIVIEQEHASNRAPAAKNDPSKYLVELFSANNLPSILLFFAGWGGIAGGVCTLRDIRKQTVLLGQYVEATKQMA